jgi:hypothetical protein
MGVGVTELLLAIVVLVVAFLLGRAILLWYWRVNEGIDLLKSINEKLGLMVPKQPASDSTEDAAEFQAWLKAQNRHMKDMSWEEITQYRQAFDYKRKQGEI